MSSGGWIHRGWRGPEQGWSSLLLLLALLSLLGVSIADSRPLPLVPGGPSASGWLIGLMVVAGLLGFVLASSRLGVVRAHLVGATVAAVLLLMVAGAAVLGTGAPVPLGIDEAGAAMVAVWERLDRDVTAYLSDADSAPTMANYLILGAICWTTAQFSAFSIFRYERAGPAVLAIGTLLLLNIGLGPLDPDAMTLPVVPMLAGFATLAMLLLMRLQFTHQRQQWARRHISDGGEVARLFLRSGVVFVVVAVLGASSLTAWATVERQEVDLGDLGGPMADLGDELSRWLGIVGLRPSEGRATTTIDDSWTIGDEWQRPNGVAFIAQTDGQLRGNYWWGTAHDTFDGRGWDRQRLEEIRVPADEPLPVPELASAGGDHLLTTTITVEGDGAVRGNVFRPAEAGVISRPVDVTIVDDAGGIGDIRFEEPLTVGESVVIDSWVRDYSADASTLTARDLRAAGDRYPDWIDGYLQGTDPAISGERIGREARRIEARFETAYERALEAQRTLLGMAYTTDMRGVCGSDEPIPECVLRAERGFCQHYATTMAMLLRTMGIPSRVITGYLPGERVDEAWVVDQAAYHNWVEAYFPDIGWVRFDPTPRDEFGLTPTDLPEGPPPTQSPARPEPTDEPTGPQTFEPDETPPPLAAGTLQDRGPGGRRTLLLGGGLLLLVLVAVVGVILFVRFRRLARADGDVAYRGIVSMATRLGHGPHPAQTEYEYAGSLSETIPTVREDIYLVVGARVESAYAQRSVQDGQRGALRRAYARVRTALLRLSLRWRR